jgi:hypothetical protein
LKKLSLAFSLSQKSKFLGVGSSIQHRALDYFKSYDDGITPTARWQICIPTDQLITLVRWFCKILGHCGIHRLCDSIATHFSHPRLRATVNDVIKHCRAFQSNKLTGPSGYGHLPPREATASPFPEVVANTLVIMLSQNPPANVANGGKLVDNAIATSLHAARSTIHCTLGISPGDLVLYHDMLLDIPLLTNFQLICDRI